MVAALAPLQIVHEVSQIQSPKAVSVLMASKAEAQPAVT